MDSRKEKHWYFLTLLKAKHASGKRPNRITGLNEGVWKATGCAIPIIDHDDENITLGYKRSFCYHQKKPKKGKTNWLMHELSTIDDNINVSMDACGVFSQCCLLTFNPIFNLRFCLCSGFYAKSIIIQVGLKAVKKLREQAMLRLNCLIQMMLTIVSAHHKNPLQL